MNTLIANYSITLISISIACTLVLSIFSNSPLKGVLKTLCSFLILYSILTIISPLLTSLSKITIEIPDNGEQQKTTEYDEAIITEAGRYICVYTKDMICKTFAIEKEQINVSVTLERPEGIDTEVDVTMITVELVGVSEVNKQAIAELVSEHLNCKCTVLASNL